MKTLLGYILPIIVIFAIACYFVYLKFQPTVGNLSYYQQQFKAFKEHWILVLIAILAYLYMQILVPKIWGKDKK
jgi:hypothetical protein